MCQSGATFLPADYCFTIKIKLSVLVIYKLDIISHWNDICSRHYIAQNCSLGMNYQSLAHITDKPFFFQIEYKTIDNIHQESFFNHFPSKYSLYLKLFQLKWYLCFAIAFLQLSYKNWSWIITAFRKMDSLFIISAILIFIKYV